MNNASFSPSSFQDGGSDQICELKTVKQMGDHEPKYTPTSTTDFKSTIPTISGEITQREGATLVFKNVCVTLGKSDILKNVSGLAKVGQMLAVMGPTGAGKTTLLNTLTGRIPARSGSILLNDQPMSRKLRRKISYVQQQDVFYPNLTLKETLTFSTLVQLPDAMPRELKMQRMQEIVDALELNKCLNTKIGGTFITGLSGGERKRASIACELLINPKIILLDEPTSGLDSAIAFSLMSLLDKYSRQSHKTVVTTIHQPASQIFHMFTNVLLLADGEVAYFGRGNRIIDFFAQLGLHCDPLYNPADFILEQVSADDDTVKRVKEGAAELRLRKEWPAELRDDKRRPEDPSESSSSSINDCSGVDNIQEFEIERTPVHVHTRLQEVNVDKYFVDNSKWQTSFPTQYKMLTWRAFVHSKDRFLSPLNLIQLGMAILAGLEWWQLERSEQTSKDRLGILFFLIVQFGFIPIMEAIFQIFDNDGVFIRDRACGIYRLSAYYLAIMTSELPMTLILCTTYLVVVYWMTGLMPVAYNFFMFWFMLILSAMAAQSFGYFTGVLVRNNNFLVPVATTIVILSLLVGGFYNAHLASWFVWMKYLSYITYVLGALSKIEFGYGYDLKCNSPNRTQYPAYCSGNGTDGLVPGEEFLIANSLDFLPFYAYFIIIFSLAIVLRILTYLILRYLRRPTT